MELFNEPQNLTEPIYFIRLVNKQGFEGYYSYRIFRNYLRLGDLKDTLLFSRNIKELCMSLINCPYIDNLDCESFILVRADNFPLSGILCRPLDQNIGNSYVLSLLISEEVVLTDIEVFKSKEEMLKYVINQ